MAGRHPRQGRGPARAGLVHRRAPRVRFLAWFGGRDGQGVRRAVRAGSAPISARRFNDMFGRLRKSFEWADRQQVTAQTVRRYAVERMVNRFGIGVATTFAHIKPTSHAARPEMVEYAQVELFSGDHPWLHRTPYPPR